MFKENEYEYIETFLARQKLHLAYCPSFGTLPL